MYYRVFFFLLVLLSGSLSAANISKYFKGCPGKSSKNKMEGIDFIYMINLDQRPEKFAQSAAQLKPYGIYPYRFSAVNGWELSTDVLNSVGVTYHSWMCSDLMGTCYTPDNEGKPTHELMEVLGRNYYSHCLSPGAIAINLSQCSVLENAYKWGYKTIWVMEDDIEVIRNPNELTALIDLLDRTVGEKNWDILFTDPDTKRSDGTYIPCTGYAKRPNFTPENPERFAKRTIINEHFTKVGARYGAYSMIIRRSGVKKILNFMKRYSIFLPYDMEYCLPNDINLYSLRYDVVSTLPEALSDNGAPRYNKN